MIAKIHSGQGFAGLVDYANDIKNKNAEIIASEDVDLTSNKSITASFSLQAKSRPSLKNFVGHISLSFAPEDAPKLSNRLMANIAKEYLQRMGIVNTQYIISRHHDKPHPHVHIAYNRVNNDGNAIFGDQNFRKSARITQALTSEYNLTFGKGKKKVNRDRLKGKDVIKYRIYDIVKGGLEVCIDWKELKNGLIAEGISLDFTYKTDGRIKGVVFTCDDISFGGYRIDRTMTYKNIDRRLQTNLEEYNRLIASMEEKRQRNISSHSENQPHEKSSVSENKTADMSAGISGTAGASGGGSLIVEKIAATAMEMTVQPHIAPVLGVGGGSDNDRGWRDEDEEKDRSYGPYRRRR